MENETRAPRRGRGRTLLYILIGLIVLNLVVNITFRWMLKNRPNLIPANVREAIEKAQAEAEARKASIG